MLILRFIPSDHHRLGLAEPSGANLPRRGCFPLMFILDVRIESRIAEVPLSTDTDIVALHWIVSGPPLPSGHELLLTLEIILL